MTSISIHDFVLLSVFMIQSKIIHVTMFSTKKNINTFDVLTFIQIRADANKWRDGCTHKKVSRLNKKFVSTLVKK